MSELDIVLRGGHVVDGTGIPKYTTDVGIRNGRIAEIGRIDAARGGRVLDVDGLIVAPGHVDLHTHYDAQIQWDPWCTISGWHGVTTVALGNCGFGFAPVRPEDRERAMLTMSRTEIDRLLDEAMTAGTCGWSLQRMGQLTSQTDFDGTPMATDTMEEADLFALGRVLGRRGEGFIQITQASERKLKDNQAVVERLAEASGRPVLFNVVQAVNDYPDVHRRQMAWLEDCHRRGLAVYGQGVTVRQPFHVSLEEWNLYDMAKTWNRSLQGSLEEKMCNLRDAEKRRAMVEEYDAGHIPLAVLGGGVEDWLIEGAMNAPSLDPLLGRSVGEVAKERGDHPVECLFDLSLEADLKASFLTQSASGDDPEHVAELLSSPYVMAGVSDGGAHGKFTVGGAYPTDVLEWLVREEGVLSAEQAHHKLAWLPAQAAGLRDRGAVIEGLAADLIVYDADRIKRAPDWTSAEIVHDQPAGEWRRIQKAEGYHYTLVQGEVTFEGDRCTGATPGRLIRHGRA